MIKQEFDKIDCDADLSNLPKIFTSISENLNSPSEKNFETIRVSSLNENENVSTLRNNTFADLTFSEFRGFQISKIEPNAFDKAFKTISYFDCYNCFNRYSQLNNNIWPILNKMPILNFLILGINTAEIPSNAFRLNEQESKLSYIRLKVLQNVIIKSNAFANLNQLNILEFLQTTFKSIGDQILKVDKKSEKKLVISFSFSNITGHSFSSKSFDGIQRPVKMYFTETNIDFLPEATFKSFLNSHQNNSINFYDDRLVVNKSMIDCFNCNNYWLIKEQKQNQVINTFCKHNKKVILFDKEIQQNLKSKCE